jgi:hypothetical protein
MSLNWALLSANSSLAAGAEKAVELHELQKEILPYFEAPYWGMSSHCVSLTTRVLTLSLI